MQTTYFKTIGVKICDKIVLISVIDEDTLNIGELPNIFEVQSLKLPETIYTGTYPTIKINNETLKERKDLIGMGIAGIVTEESWYLKTDKKKDSLGISLK